MGFPPSLGGVGAQHQHDQGRRKGEPPGPTLGGAPTDPSQAKIGPGRWRLRNVLLTPFRGWPVWRFPIFLPSCLFAVVSRRCSSWVVFSGGFVWFGFLPRSVWRWGVLLPWGMLGPNENPTRGEEEANPPCQPTRGGTSPRPARVWGRLGRVGGCLKRLMAPTFRGWAVWRAPIFPAMGLSLWFRLALLRGCL